MDILGALFALVSVDISLCECFRLNKLASLEATLVRNSSKSLTRVKSRPTSVAKKKQSLHPVNPNARTKRNVDCAAVY